MKLEVEHTDTFGGEANYSWVVRKTIEVPDGASDRVIVAKAKAAVGMTGVRCKRQDIGDMIQLDPQGYLQRIFITFQQ